MKESELKKRVVVLFRKLTGGRTFMNNTGVGHVGTVASRTKSTITLKDSRVQQFGFGAGSADVIGIMPVVITPEMVGKTVGVFTAIETKKPGWSYRGTPHEMDQLNWLNMVKDRGGVGAFVQSSSDLENMIGGYCGRE